jgi:hypothetical protein
MIFDKRCKLRPDKPANLCARKTLMQSCKGRQRQDYVTQRAGLDYQDVFETFRHNKTIVSKKEILSN